MTERYTHGHDDAVLRSHGWRTAENSARYLLDVLAPGASVLDVGCGPGTITADLARAVGDGQVLGLDRSAEVVARAAATHGATNLRFDVGDAYELDHPNDAFDVVHAHQVLQHLGDPVRALTELRRVCRPGGLVAVRDADFSAMSWWPDVPGLQEWREVYLQVARANGGEPDAGRHLLGWAEDAGLRQLRWSASTWCFTSEEDRGWWSRTWADRITGTDLADQAIELGVTDRELLERCGDAWTRWASQPEACFVVPHGEVTGRA